MEISSCRHANATLKNILNLSSGNQRGIALVLGLNLTDYPALSILDASESMTVGQLPASRGATAATTTAITSRLEKHGHVTRHRSSTGRPHVHVSATPEATQKIPDLIHPLVDAINQHFQALTPAQSSTVLSFLDIAQEPLHDQPLALLKKDAI